jgi:hypothetical protein
MLSAMTSRGRMLAACPDHRRIVRTTGGVAPPGCPLETFAEIGRWRVDLKLRLWRTDTSAPRRRSARA